MFSKTYFSTDPVWEERNAPLFDEMILSWNGIRPKRGKWIFWVSLKEGEWLRYAEWGPASQKTFQSEGSFARTYQDAVLPNTLCTGFRVKVEGEELDQLHSLSACVSHLANHSLALPSDLPPVLLKSIPRQSQMLLNHPRRESLCSPTATSTAMKILTGRPFDPVDFAKCVYDEGFDIYGNWILSVAEAYHQIRSPCRVERLADFTALHAHLMQGRPVVVSVKGAIANAPQRYDAGHLLCVVGYENGKVYCIDSAFADHESTFIGYDCKDFAAAWGVRRNLAYVFS